MAEITEVKLNITTSPLRPELTLEGATALIEVTLEIELDPASSLDQDGYEGRFEILGGSGARQRRLFDLNWGGLIEWEFRGRTFRFPLIYDRFDVSLEQGRKQSITRKQRVARSKLNEDPAVEIRFREPIPSEFDPRNYPIPEGHLPWEIPHAPVDITDQANDVITARVELTGRRGGETLTAESEPVIRAF